MGMTSSEVQHIQAFSVLLFQSNLKPQSEVLNAFTLQGTFCRSFDSSSAQNDRSNFSKQRLSDNNDDKIHNEHKDLKKK